MKYFFDTEFEESNGTIMPLSFGMVDLNENELYMEFDFDEERANQNEWIRDNVLPHLHLPAEQRVSKAQARDRIIGFMRLSQNPIASIRKTQMWAYYASTDWVLLYQLWGTLLDLPKNIIPKHCMCLQQWFALLDYPEEYPDYSARRRVRDPDYPDSIPMPDPDWRSVKPPKPKDAHNALADAKWNLEFYRRLEKYDRWQRS